MGGWVDGWVAGRVGVDQKGPSISIIFEHINTQDVLFTNIVSKVISSFCMGLELLFKVMGGGHSFRNYPIYEGF